MPSEVIATAVSFVPIFSTVFCAHSALWFSISSNFLIYLRCVLLSLTSDYSRRFARLSEAVDIGFVLRKDYTIALSKADTVSRTASLYGFSGESQAAILLCGIITGILAWMSFIPPAASIVRIEKDGSRSFDERIYSPAIYNGSSLALWRT